ncbi:MAG: hypothetical protein GEU90_03400 [Gemmatimonas sp.]|nr:hypothetical protein [Gemmatimonas sp.]
MGVLALADSTAAQAAARDGGDYVAPRTVWGHPDLQGNWRNATLTPLERPRGQGPTLTEAQVAEMEGALRARFAEDASPSDPNRAAPPVGGDGSTGAAGGVGGYNTIYIDPGERVARVNGEYRSSLITNPPDGRIPELTDEARQQLMAARQSRGSFGIYDNPENRPIGERCILSFGSNAGPPMLPNGFYNNNYTIVQNEDHILILVEMVHDVRIIRLWDGEELPESMRPWFGDSWGHWEGETLVVETTNIHPSQGFRGSPAEGARVVERFRRADENTVVYEFTVHDPAYTLPWGGEVPMNRMDEQLYEYACHEGNYALSNVLSGARAEERREAEAADPEDRR